MADEESQPLLQKTQTADVRPAVISKCTDDTQDATNYRMTGLGSWWTMVALEGTVFHRRGVWMVMLRLAIIWISVGLLVIFFIQQPDRLRVSRFRTLGTFLNVFVGLLLGFFLSSSMHRWYACVDGFLSLMDSIRNLQMQLMALGVEEDKIQDVLRYGVLSVNMLEMELQIEGMPAHKQTKHMEKHWGEFSQKICSVTGKDKEFCHMNAEEAAALSKVDDPAAVIWIWVSAIIASMAQDGDIPPLASPTYGRIAQLSQDAHGGIRQVKQSIMVKPPYIYAQLLAWLVHTNNIINALSFGLTWGVTVAVASRWQNPNPEAGQKATFGEVLRDSQSAIVSCFVSCFGPFIYQALLEVAIAIASPFSSPDAALPVHKFLTNLEVDLSHSRDVNAALPKKWGRPRFKKPAAS